MYLKSFNQGQRLGVKRVDSLSQYIIGCSIFDTTSHFFHSVHHESYPGPCINPEFNVMKS